MHVLVQCVVGTIVQMHWLWLPSGGLGGVVVVVVVVAEVETQTEAETDDRDR